MKICIISPVVVPILGLKQKYGGIESVIYNVVKELTKKGHEVIVYASGDSTVDGKLVPTVREALGQGVSFAKEAEINKKAYQLAIKEKPDVIWDHTLAVHSQKMINNNSKYLFKPTIILAHNNILNSGEIPVVHTLHGPAKNHLPDVVRRLSEKGHYFVSISKDQARRYLDFIKKGQHLGTVYNPINTEHYHATRDKANNYLLWVGRYCMEKSPHLAILAAKNTELPIYLIGKKQENHEKEYFDKFVKPLLDEKAISLGQLPADQIAKYYRHAKALLMTNLWPEPFGLVVAEAMASGTPVLGPAIGSLTELIDDSGVLISVDDLPLSENETKVTQTQLKYVERITEGIKKLDDIPSEVPRKRAEFLFSPSHATDGYEEAFLKAIYLKKREVNREKLNIMQTIKGKSFY